jgi:hypothetical protein
MANKLETLLNDYIDANRADSDASYEAFGKLQKRVVNALRKLPGDVPNELVRTVLAQVNATDVLQELPECSAELRALARQAMDEPGGVTLETTFARSLIAASDESERWLSTLALASDLLRYLRRGGLPDKRKTCERLGELGNAAIAEHLLAAMVAHPPSADASWNQSERRLPVLWVVLAHAEGKDLEGLLELLASYDDSLTHLIVLGESMKYAERDDIERIRAVIEARVIERSSHSPYDVLCRELGIDVTPLCFDHFDIRVGSKADPDPLYQSQSVRYIISHACNPAWMVEIRDGQRYLQAPPIDGIDEPDPAIEIEPEPAYIRRFMERAARDAGLELDFEGLVVTPKKHAERVRHFILTGELSRARPREKALAGELSKATKKAKKKDGGKKTDKLARARELIDAWLKIPQNVAGSREEAEVSRLLTMLPPGLDETLVEKALAHGEAIMVVATCARMRRDYLKALGRVIDTLVEPSAYKLLPLKLLQAALADYDDSDDAEQRYRRVSAFVRAVDGLSQLPRDPKTKKRLIAAMTEDVAAAIVTALDGYTYDGGLGDIVPYYLCLFALARDAHAASGKRLLEQVATLDDMHLDVATRMITLARPSPHADATLAAIRARLDEPAL